MPRSGCLKTAADAVITEWSTGRRDGTTGQQSVITGQYRPYDGGRAGAGTGRRDKTANSQNGWYSHLVSVYEYQPLSR